MILVTVGTTMPFDGLVRSVDSAVAAGLIEQDVICQIGNGAYEPRHCKFFRFKPEAEFNPLRDAADIVIGHGGTGTILSMLEGGHRFIAVVNPAAADGHQEDFLRRLAKDTSLCWTSNPDDVAALVRAVRQPGAVPVRPFAPSSLVDEMVSFIASST